MDDMTVSHDPQSEAKLFRSAPEGVFDHDLLPADGTWFKLKYIDVGHLLVDG